MEKDKRKARKRKEGHRKGRGRDKRRVREEQERMKGERGRGKVTDCGARGRDRWTGEEGNGGEGTEEERDKKREK
jgi:hypothetical protein